MSWPIPIPIILPVRHSHGHGAPMPDWFMFSWLVYFVFSWPLHTLILYRDLRYEDSGFPLSSKREDFGFALLMGSVASLIGPFGTFLILCLTGFAKGGIRHQRLKKGLMR